MGDTVGYWSLVVLLIGATAVILQIVVFRIHAFIALVVSGIFFDRCFSSQVRSVSVLFDGKL